MLRVAVYVAAIALSILLLATSCGEGQASVVGIGTSLGATSDAEAAAEVRAELQGTFTSETQFQMPRVVQGELKMVYEHYYLTFRTEDVIITQDDMCAQQPYWVDGEGNIALSEDTLSRERAIGHYERESGRVEWNGLWYSPR